MIQRDSVMFASKLHPCLAEMAATNEREVSSRYRVLSTWNMVLLNLTIR